MSPKKIIPGVTMLGKKNNAPAPKKKVTEKYFQQAGNIWIKVYGELLPPDPEDGSIADPGFWKDGAEKKHLKLILIDLRERAEKKNIVWTEAAMEERLRAFILRSWDDDWISKNFMLRIINQNKTKIFNNQITPKKNEHSKSVGNTKGEIYDSI